MLGESIEGSGPRWEPTAANWGTIGLSGGVDHHHQPQHIWTLLDELQSDARCTMQYNMHYALCSTLFTVHNMWGSTMGLHNILYELPLMSWWTMLTKQFQMVISLQPMNSAAVRHSMRNPLEYDLYWKTLVAVYCKLCWEVFTSQRDSHKALWQSASLPTPSTPWRLLTHRCCLLLLADADADLYFISFCALKIQR